MGKNIDELIEEERQAVKEGWVIIGSKPKSKPKQKQRCYNCIHFNSRWGNICNTQAKIFWKYIKPKHMKTKNLVHIKCPDLEWCEKWSGCWQRR